MLWVNGGRPGVEEFTGNSFVRRACARSPDLAWAVLPVPNAAGEDAVGYYKQAIAFGLARKGLFGVAG
jgi:hypothetical protein